MMLRRVGIMILLLSGLQGCAGKAELIDADAVTVLRGATLLDGTGAPSKRSAVVVLKGDRILKVGSDGQFRYRDDARVLDITGKYLAPGFIDTHVHSRDLPAIARTLVAFGITTIRSPADENGVDVRRDLESGTLLGPTLVPAGKLIDHPIDRLANEGRWGAMVTTEAEVRAEVRRQAERGVNYVKVYMGMPPALLRAAVEEAHGRGVKVVGHIHCTSWTEAAEAGIDVLVHSGSEGPAWELLDGVSREEGRNRCGDFGAYLRAWSRSAQQVDLHGPPMERLIRALLDHHVEVNPTLVVIESLYWGDDSTAGQRLEPSYAPEKLRESWGPDWEHSNPFMRQFKLSDDEWAQLKRGFQGSKNMVRLLHDRGVLLTAGSDVAMPWITPGVAFHRELELLRSTGISTTDVLTIATLNGAKALGLEAKVGSIQEGKIADLVILSANPVEDIRATRQIEYVVAKGHVYAPSELLRHE